MARRSPWAAAALGMGCLVLSLMGCGSEESASDEAPPNHIVKAPESQGKWRYGVQDTIAIEFDEAIDTAELQVEFSDTSGKAWRFDGRDRLLLYGTKDTLVGVHFPVNAPFSVALRNLKDLFGNEREVVEEEFMPWRWVDQDYLDQTFLGYDSLLLDDSTWVDGTSLRDSLVLEAKLDGNVNIGLQDPTDLKILRLQAPDTLIISLRTRRDLDIELQAGGPFPQDGLESAINKFTFPDGILTGSSGEADTTLVAKYEDHHRVLKNPSAIGVYALKLGVVERKAEGFYRLVLKVRKFRN